MFNNPNCRKILATLLFAGLLTLRLAAQYYPDYPSIKIKKTAAGISNGGMFEPEKLIINKSNDAMIISWDELNRPGPPPAGRVQIPIYSLWIEPGDGNYITSIPADLSYTFKRDQTSPALMYATKIYEHTRRPPTSTSASRETAIMPPGTIPASISSPELRDENLVALFCNVREVVPGDPMVFGISYKALRIGDKGPTEYRVIFRYNSNDSPAFHPVDEGGDLKSTIWSTTTSQDTLVNDIRTYNNENIVILNSANNDEQAGWLTSRSEGVVKIFKNGILFDGITVSNRNSNIFISLKSVDSADLPYNIDFEAELQALQYEGGWVTLGKGMLTHLNSASAHDPNGISVSPAFLTLPQQVRKLHYDIDFQNTGLGDAKAVKVAFFCPPKMDWSRADKISNIIASYSEKNDYDKSKIDIHYDEANSRIIFTINDPDVLLDGTMGIPDPINNRLTKGRISFDLQVLPDANVKKQETLQAWADIYFLGQYPSNDSIPVSMVDKGIFLTGTASYELPVRTTDAVVAYIPACEKKDSIATTSCCPVPKKFFPRLGYAIRTVFGNPCKTTQPSKDTPVKNKR